MAGRGLLCKIGGEREEERERERERERETERYRKKEITNDDKEREE